MTPSTQGAPAPTMQAPFAPWVVGAGYDQWFLLGAWAVPLVLWGGVLSLPFGFALAVAAYFLIDRSHITATIPLTFADRDGMQVRGRRYVATALCASLLALACTVQGGAWALAWRSLFPIWALYHIVRQHFGFLRLYQVRSRADARSARLEAWCLYTGTAFPFAMYLARGWGRQGVGAHFAMPVVPYPVAWLCLALFIGSAAATLWAAWSRWREGEDVGSLRLLLLALAVSNFWLAGLGPGRHGFLITGLFVSTFHGLQYHALTWHVLQLRCSAPAGAGSNRLAPLFQGTPWRYLGATLLGGLVLIAAQGSMSPAVARWAAEHARWVEGAANLGFGVLYTHYLLDAWVWKIGSDARLRSELGLVQPAFTAVPQAP